MKTYAKLTETGQLETLARVPHVVNATADEMAAYAAANGYKELRRTEKPGRYYAQGWHETAKLITETWTAWELEEAKKDALETVQGRRDAAMFGADGKGVVIECAALPNGVLFNAEAHNMVNSLMLLDAKGAVPASAKWTDAADVAHPVTTELIAALGAAMMGHIQGVQDKYEPARDAVNAAEDVEAVEAALEMAEQNCG